MNDIEAQVMAAWYEDAPPARDAGFRIAVLGRIERRRFAQRMALLLATGAASIVAIMVCAPLLGEAVTALPANIALEITAGLCLFSIAWGFSRAFRLRLF